MLRVSLPITVFLSALYSAGAHACTEHKLNDGDMQNLHAAVEKIVERHTAMWSSVYACNDDAGGTLAWMDFKPEPQSDGTSIDNSAECAETAGAWDCKLASARHATVSVVLAGHEKAFDIDAPLDFDREQMAAVIRHAHESAPSMTAAQWCGDAGRNPSLAKELRASQKAFSFIRPRTEGVIEEKDGVSLTVDSQVVRFTRDAASPKALAFRCWQKEADLEGGPT